MSRTVKVNPLLVLLSILVGAEIGSWIGGIFGAFVAALLAIPAAGAFQVLIREIWRASSSEPGTPQAIGAIVVEPEVTDAARGIREADENDDAAGTGQQAARRT
jgi:hypothetical protein